MNSNVLLQVFQFSRLSLNQILESVSEDQATKIPAGFNNSILWNTGHILIAQEQFLFGKTNRKIYLPDHYMELFWRGTKPTDWKIDPPTLSTLLTQLQDQTIRVKETFTGGLDEILETPLEMPGNPPFETVAEVLSLQIYHEATHIGVIKSMKRIAE